MGYCSLYKKEKPREISCAFQWNNSQDIVHCTSKKSQESALDKTKTALATAVLVISVTPQ